MEGGGNFFPILPAVEDIQFAHHAVLRVSSRITFWQAFYTAAGGVRSPVPLIEMPYINGQS